MTYNKTTGKCKCMRCHKTWTSLKLIKTGKPPCQCAICKQYRWETPAR